MQYTPKKLHYKPFTLNIIIYLCPQNKISNNPIHVGLYVGFGGINQMHLLIINNLSSKYYQNTYHSCGTDSPQLENVEPATVGRSFVTGKRTKTIKQSLVFIRP